MLRVMIPGVQRTFFRVCQAAQDYSLESLMDSKVRRELVQQMSSASNAIPGSIGERRKMRQELEAMVCQVEAEAADLGMDGGVGRVALSVQFFSAPYVAPGGASWHASS